MMFLSFRSFCFLGLTLDITGLRQMGITARVLILPGAPTRTRATAGASRPAVGVDDSYYRERLADVVRLLYQEAGGRSSRSMTRRIARRRPLADRWLR